MKLNALFILLVFVPVLVLILLSLNLLLSVSKPDSEKNQAYECGFIPKFENIYTKFNVFHFSLGLCFLIFDLELLLLMPITVSLRMVDMFGLTLALVFFINLTIGFVLEISQSLIKLSDISLISSTVITVKE